VVSVSLELVLGLALALALHRRGRAISLARVAALIPWAVPTVVAGLLFRFLFDGRGSLANLILSNAGASPISWLSGEWSAWLPIVAADVWKTTPFSTLLLLAGLSSIDPRLYEAARVDGALRWQTFVHVTLPISAFPTREFPRR
jgi:ABC-type sugar transport system permease subunit